METPALKTPCLKRLFLAAFLFLAAAARGADFSVTSPGFFYAINGQQPNPTLTLVRGQTYTFAVSTLASHPFRILAAAGAVENNNISAGTITFHVPTNAVSYTYECSIHHFVGTIQTVAPTPPPEPRILNLEVGEKLTVRSVGTGELQVRPEFATNLADPRWFALTVETNRVRNGTNDTICGRPEGTNVFIRINAVP